VPPIHNSNNVKKCLREVPGVTGAVFEFYCDTSGRIREKKQRRRRLSQCGPRYGGCGRYRMGQKEKGMPTV
jgi:hypothetical protein